MAKRYRPDISAANFEAWKAVIPSLGATYADWVAEQDQNERATTIGFATEIVAVTPNEFKAYCDANKIAPSMHELSNFCFWRANRAPQ